MILREYLIAHIGKVARIGCERGSGFVFADRIGLNIPRNIKEMMEREVISISPSVYGGDIVLVEGNDYGSEWLPKILENPPTDIVPDEMYVRTADKICGLLVECLWIEMVKTRSAVWESKRIDAWNMVDYYRAAILSPQFATLCPKADGNEILSLLEQRFERQFGQSFWEGKPCTKTQTDS